MQARRKRDYDGCVRILNGLRRRSRPGPTYYEPMAKKGKNLKTKLAVVD